ncbi:folylpolyglutamate synthetase [Trypanosoma cruzi]|uniref:tetrahydrofolate synthase n=1 Tax=Trypanosoma cruzi TaxID=5693 RepID=A0A2V2V0B0_TRYCR|nr:folylpolyglutamate synthetase [Trypanosoma cruzi]
MSMNAAVCGRTFNDVVRLIESWAIGKVASSYNNLETTRLFIDRLNMQGYLDKLRFVHVAGTKGKGTTAAYTAALLQAYGLRVGLFASPHLVDVRERILVNNAFLPKDVFTRQFFKLFDRIADLSNSESQISRDLSKRTSFFSFLFLLSLYIFAEELVDVVVVEVGVGGRIDATNIISPEVTVITSLGLDHTEVLGNTIEEIALEKAGIMKPGVICYTSPQEWHPSTLTVMEKHALGQQTPFVVVDEKTLPIFNWPPLAIGGNHVIEDSKLALLAARYMAGIPPTLPLSSAERQVLQTMTLPGRSQVLSINGGTGATLYLDCAHTYESLTCATRWFMEESRSLTGDANPRRVLVFYSTRDATHVLKSFMPFIHCFSKMIAAFVVNPRKATGNTADGRYDYARGEVAAVTSCWKEMYREVPCIPCKAPFSSLEELIDVAVPAATEREDALKPVQVFVTGSFFLLSDIMGLLQAHDESKFQTKLKEDSKEG